jgi:hypothetical protein
MYRNCDSKDDTLSPDLCWFIPKPVWAVGFALEQPLHVVTLAQRSALQIHRSFMNFEVA